MPISKEQFEGLPEAVASEYEQDGEQYRHKSEGKASALKASLDALDGKYKTVEQQVKEILESQEAKIEQAKRDALEQAKTKGDVNAVEKRYQEQMADLEKRSNQSLEELKAELDELRNTNKKSGRSALLADIASELNVFDDSRKAFSKLVQDRIDVDPKTGKATYLDEDGGATSLDKAGFISELEKDPAYNRMRQAKTNTGGNANGNSGNGGGASKKFNDHTAEELKALRASNPAEYDRLKAQR